VALLFVAFAHSTMGSREPKKLLDHFESHQVHDSWLNQSKTILIWIGKG